MWSRALLVGFVLAFGLNAVAHAAHQHEPASATSSLHSTTCGYCVSFGSLAGAPTHVAPVVTAPLDIFAIPASDAPVPHKRARRFSQPRAPPALI